MIHRSFSTLDDWLQWQETLHPSEIDLGLERVNSVYQALSLTTSGRVVVTVGGTNGKGSCIAMLEHLFRAAGYRVGSYTSPHLLRYNERIRVEAKAVTDQAIIDAFVVIDLARGEHSLTYFEFGTLAALHVFAEHDLDLVLLEVGMGGRLDATNIIDPDISLITSIGLDHQAWLGQTREAIALEKAGIMRSGKPAVCADAQPPQSLLDRAAELGAKFYQVGHEFQFSISSQQWSWIGSDCQNQPIQYQHLPLPSASSVSAHVANAAAVLQVAQLLKAVLPTKIEHIERAMLESALPGRCYLLQQEPEVWLDVAHNLDACAVLAEHLAGLGKKTTHLLIGILADKSAAEMIERLKHQADYYHLAALSCSRAMPMAQLRASLPENVEANNVSEYTSVQQALSTLLRKVGANERIVVTGSFYTVAEAMAVSPS